MSSPVFSTGPNTSIQQLFEWFQQKRYRHIPIVDSAAHLIGIVSDRDALRQLSSVKEADSLVKDFMINKVLTCTVDTDVSELAKTLLEQHIGALPVVDERGLLVGIITRSDVLRVVLNRLSTELWV
ncbi:MAG: CBS domain-containing protein [Pseudomonadales bacterium]|nr:CBS domain-containing protein [Pseudomonadales bacterium]